MKIDIRIDEDIRINYGDIITMGKEVYLVCSSQFTMNDLDINDSSLDEFILVRTDGHGVHGESYTKSALVEGIKKHLYNHYPQEKFKMELKAL